ncbi:hypothetical protein [Salmonella enterica]|uniref:hypothetical protein n=1 Tax=Salmonella enterica TaxID=28901 RepID=UPI00398C524A
MSGGINQVKAADPVNDFGEQVKHHTVNNAYRFQLWRDQHKHGVFQITVHLTEDDMALDAYQVEFTG